MSQYRRLHNTQFQAQDVVGRMAEFRYSPCSIIRKDLKDKIDVLRNLGLLAKKLEIKNQTEEYVHDNLILAQLSKIAHLFNKHAARKKAKNKREDAFYAEQEEKNKEAERIDIKEHLAELEGLSKEAYITYHEYFNLAYENTLESLYNLTELSDIEKEYYNQEAQKLSQELQKPEPDPKAIKDINPAIQFGILGKVINQQGIELEHDTVLDILLPEHKEEICQLAEAACSMVSNQICPALEDERTDENLKQQEAILHARQEAQKHIAVKVLACKFRPKPEPKQQSEENPQQEKELAKANWEKAKQVLEQCKQPNAQNIICQAIVQMTKQGLKSKALNLRLQNKSAEIIAKMSTQDDRVLSKRPSM